MSIVTSILMLIVAAMGVYGVKLAFEEKWKELIMLAVVVILFIWILSGLGYNLPNLG